MKVPVFDPERHIGTCVDCGKRCCSDRIAGPLRAGEAYGWGELEYCCCNDCAAAFTAELQAKK